MPFADVPEGAWYHDDVQRAYDSGLINGRSETTFAPDANIVYAEAVKLAACMHQKSSAGSVTLANGTPWYQTYVDYAQAHEIICESYDWTAVVDRARFIEIFAHALPDEALAAKNEIADNAIPDVTMSHTNAEAIYKLYRAGVLVGTGADHACAPEKNISRAEVAAVLTRMMDPSRRLSLSLTEAEPGRERMLLIDEHLYTTAPLEENVVIDEATGIRFVNNELLIHGVNGADRDAMLALIAARGGAVVGEISFTDSYQVCFPQVYACAELEALAAEIERDPLVEWTSLNLVYGVGANDAPSWEDDAAWASDWDDRYPSGRNWGVEAIHAPEAWAYQDDMRPVNVGVIDTYLVKSKDLRFEKIYRNSPKPENDSYVIHGAHVSGTIAALDNDIGIVGVVPSNLAKLYGFFGSPSVIRRYVSKVQHVLSQCDFDYTFKDEFAVSKMCKDQCRVINYSMGYEDDSISPYDASFDTASEGMGEQSRALALAYGKEMGKYLNDKILGKGYDFLICAAAGNDDLRRPGVDAIYNSCFNAIMSSDYPDVYDRIIVVGACDTDKKGNYTFADFSYTGDRVDVVAPGVDICSLTGDTKGTVNVKDLEGTSQATPHVTGTAAMLFALNPSLTGAQVKKIIVETATTPVSGTDAKMSNAAEAVETVYAELPITLIGTIRDESGSRSLPGATVTVYGKKSGRTEEILLRTETVGVNGELSCQFSIKGLFLTRVEISFFGYETKTIPLEGDTTKKLYDLGLIIMVPVAVPKVDNVWKDAYIQVLGKAPAESEYVLYNMDFDGTPELLLKEVKNGANTFEYIYTYRNGKAEMLCSHNIAFSAVLTAPFRDLGNGHLASTSFARMTGEACTYEYYIENGALQARLYKEYRMKSFADDLPGTMFTWNSVGSLEAVRND